MRLFALIGLLLAFAQSHGFMKLPPVMWLNAGVRGTGLYLDDRTILASPVENFGCLAAFDKKTGLTKAFFDYATSFNPGRIYDSGRKCFGLIGGYYAGTVNLQTGSVTQHVEILNPIRSYDISPSLGIIAVTFTNSLDIYLYSFPSLQFIKTIRYHTEGERLVKFNDTGSILYCEGPLGVSSSVTFYDTSLGSFTRNFIFAGKASDFKLTNDGQYIVIFSNSSQAGFITKINTTTLSGLSVYIAQVVGNGTLMLNDQVAVVACSNGTVLGINVSNLTVRYTWTGGAGSSSEPCPITFNPNGLEFAAPGGDLRLYTLDSSTGQVITGDNVPYRGSYSSLSLDDKEIYTKHGNTQIQVTDALSGRKKRAFVTPENQYYGVAPIHGTTHGVVLGAGLDTLREYQIYNLDTGSLVKKVTVPTGIAESLPAKMLNGTHKMMVLAREGILDKLRLFDLDNETYQDIYSDGITLRFDSTKDGQFIYVYAPNYLKKVRVSDLQVLWTIPTSVKYLAVSPDMRYVAASHTNRTVTVYDADTGTVVSNWDGSRTAILSLNFSNDGKTLIVGGNKLSFVNSQTGLNFDEYSFGTADCRGVSASGFSFLVDSSGSQFMFGFPGKPLLAGPLASIQP